MIIRPPNQKTHFFHAQAIGLGGRITRPFEEIVDAQAATALPIDGGRGLARIENFRFRETISFKAAYSQVIGSQSKNDGSYGTLAMTTIEELNILEVVTAKKIVSRISVHHAPDAKEPTAVAIGSRFEGLRIAGCKLEVDLSTDFPAPLNSYEGFKAANKNLVESKGMIVCSLVKEIVRKPSCTGFKINGGAIEIPQFGRIYLAQFLLTSSSRRLVMLRAELGCPAEGMLDVGCTQGNGSTYP